LGETIRLLFWNQWFVSLNAAVSVPLSGRGVTVQVPRKLDLAERGQKIAAEMIGIIDTRLGEEEESVRRHF
jgi:hypothetical protein